MTLVLATTRSDIASYVQALFSVYILLILVHILSTWLFAFGFRPGYHRWLDVVLDFLRDISQPYLKLFSRFIPAVGGIDFGPIIAIFVLGIIDTIVVNLIRGNSAFG